jgi:hypothetical protein
MFAPHMSARLLVAVTLALFCSACERLIYVPLHPMKVERSGVRAEMVRARLKTPPENAVAVQISLTVPAGASLDAVGMGSRNGAPCAGGVGAQRLSINGDEQFKGPFQSAGTYRLEAFFERDKVWEGPLKEGSTVDLTLSGAGSGRECVRLALGDESHEHTWEPEGQWFAGASAGFRSSFNTIPTVDPLLFGNLKLGRHLGSAQFALEAAIGTTGSDRILFEGGPFLGYTLLHAGKFNVNVGAGYSAIWATRVPEPPDPPPDPGTQGILPRRLLPPVPEVPVWLHGPRARLHFGFTWPEYVRAGFIGGPMISSVGFDVPLSVWIGPDGFSQPMFLVGVGLGATFAL